MEMSPLANSAMLGMQRGMEGLQRNAAEIAGANVNVQNSPLGGENVNNPMRTPEAARDFATPLVEQIQNVNQVQSSAQVMQTEDRVLGSLLDVMA